MTIGQESLYQGGMSDVTIFGPPQSSYTWTTRLVCEEKGIAYDLQVQLPGTPENLELHPFGKVPVLRHGDFELYETRAITQYLNDEFDGPNFIPSENKDAARMDQWISALSCYMYDDIVRKYVLQYIFPRGKDGNPDRETIEGTLPNIKRDIETLEAGIGDGEWLAGNAVSLADWFMLPVLTYLSNFPEGQELLTGKSRLQRIVNDLQARPSFDATVPPAPAP